MAWATEPIQISEGDLTVSTYSFIECYEIAKSIVNPHGWFERKWGLDTVEKVQARLEEYSREQVQGLCNPLVYKVNGEIAGVTRYHRLDPRANTLEIGSTWVAPKWKRTYVNTSVKKMILKYAFENLNAQRIEFRVNSKNYTSQMSMLRIGATFEGVLRHNHAYALEGPQDGHIYSIIKSDWPQIEKRFIQLLERKPVDSKYLPAQIQTPRLVLRLLCLQDAKAHFDLINRNRKILFNRFPIQGKLNSEEDVRAFIALRAHESQAGSTFGYGIWHSETQKLIGHIHLKNIVWSLPAAEIGYFMDSEMQRNGYIRESLAAVIGELKEKKFVRIYARVQLDNAASLGVLKQCGFIEEGILRASFRVGQDELSDIVSLVHSS